MMMDFENTPAPGALFQGERRIEPHFDTCKCNNPLYRKGDTIYCCKCDYTRPARRKEDRKIQSPEDWK